MSANCSMVPTCRTAATSTSSPWWIRSAPRWSTASTGVARSLRST